MPHISNQNQKPPSASINATGGGVGGGGAVGGNYTFAGATTASTLPTTSIVYNGVGTASSTIKKMSRPTQSAPKGWTTVKVRPLEMTFEGDEIHECPATGRTVHVASLTIANSAGRHHWEVFKKLHPDVSFLVAAIPGVDSCNSVMVSNILFPTEDDANVFETWLADYLVLFDNSREALYTYKLPPPPTRMPSSVQVPIYNHETMIDLAVWLMAQCQDRVYFLGGMLFFLSDEDAALYKLSFSNK